MSSVALGILSIMVGSFINNFGIVLQKRQVNRQKIPPTVGSEIKDMARFTKDPIWILGILMQTILCLPPLLYGISQLGITLAQPLANAGVIFLVAGAVGVLHERLNRIEWQGVVLLIIGMILIGFGNVVGEITQALVLEPGTLIKLLIFAMAVGIIIGILLLTRRLWKTGEIIILGLLAGVCYTIVSVSTQLLSVGLTDLWTTPAIGLRVGGILGMVAGTFAAVLVTQIAFKHGRAMNFISFSQITMNLLPIIAGIYVFGQIIGVPWAFWAGIFGIIAGSSCLARFQAE